MSHSLKKDMEAPKGAKGVPRQRMIKSISERYPKSTRQETPPSPNDQSSASESSSFSSEEASSSNNSTEPPLPPISSSSHISRWSKSVAHWNEAEVCCSGKSCNGVISDGHVRLRCRGPRRHMVCARCYRLRACCDAQEAAGRTATTTLSSKQAHDVPGCTVPDGRPKIWQYFINMV